ncbi:hypothetical protein BDN72DRAFT_787844 [Pluteus cervinus]|uniref:Uncharacterized protein n=1 Tax=Pluteus cervinus TaxID=181527 RepID=A0ACD3BBJ3_9AGAR|nr:hypothetical protein BDN72DRAFT_787844 [Pluteus cervinus]
MSFSGTPLGQGRRLDHNTFLGKPPSNSNRPPSPRHSNPTSYAYGAATLGPRSPPKFPPLRERTKAQTSDTDSNQHEPALVRFQRQKQQQEQALVTRPGGPKTITSQPNPEKWQVKDTSVVVATAFNQAAADMLPATNPNHSWASGASRSNQAVPRSTSVEYELEAQSTSSRRLAAPPSRLANRTHNASRKPPSKSSSLRQVPDSEGEEEPTDRNERGKSPFAQVIDIAKRAIGPATFYLRERSQEPEDAPANRSTNGNGNGKDSSYDYATEEKSYQASQQTKRATHRRGRISTDNKAYKPTASDDDDEDEDLLSDDGKRRRRKKKKREAHGGPLTTLPVVGQDKRRKRRSKGGRTDLAEDEESASDDEVTEVQSTQMQGSSVRTSVPPTSRQSVLRDSVPPPDTYAAPDDSMDIEQGLDSIPEVDESMIIEQPQQQQQQQRSRSVPRGVTPRSSRPYSLGGFLGNVVHYAISTFRRLIVLVLQLFALILYTIGTVFGTVYDVIFQRPSSWLRNGNIGSLAFLGKYLVLGGIMILAWMAVQEPFVNYLPEFPRSSQRTPFVAPSTPVTNLEEFSIRLQKLEAILSSLSADSERFKTKADNVATSQADLVGRLGLLESRVVNDGRKAEVADNQFKSSTSQNLKDIKQEVEVLQAQLQSHQQQRPTVGDGPSTDEEARVKLRALEDRVGGMEGNVREALELGKKASTGSATSSQAWWNKIASGSTKGLTIKSSDGQDVTVLINQLVDNAVSTYNKDVLARPDFALHSTGARIIPSLTTETFEIKPSGIRSLFSGFFGDNPIGRAPVTALHHEIHSGYCWPFAGSSGQLGVKLSAPVVISDITIDHVAKEVALDLRSAPRQMEVWAMVEGQDNIAKVQEWQTEKARLREEAIERGEEVESLEDYPASLPKIPAYIRIASFTYNIHSPAHIQTFAVDQDIKNLGVDFGVVVLRVKNNWGQDAYSCLYRFRVHGHRNAEIPPPLPEEELVSLSVSPSPL